MTDKTDFGSGSPEDDARLDDWAEPVAGPDRGDLVATRIRGAKSSGGKSGGAASGSPDTLFSTAKVSIIDLLGEGEIVGVVGGLKGIYFNDVPVQNPDNTFNFKGITAEFRVGTPDQTYMPGYPGVQAHQDVGIKVNQATPVSASIAEPETDRARVTIQIPALYIAKSDGSVRANILQYRVEARYSGGPWVNEIGDQTINGKNTSPYFRSHEITLPRNPSGSSAPWQVRITRLTQDTDGFNNSQQQWTVQSDLIFHSLTRLNDSKFSYPWSALVGLTADASSFGSSVPARTYLVDGIKMKVPTNYNVGTRTYTGLWDGTFKEEVCDNPAWVFYLLLENDRFGLGEYITPDAIDKWTLYEIGRYCDVMVSDGRGGQEPRFRFNGVIASQQDAYDVLQLVAQIFRGMAYWSSGTVTASQDRPRDVEMIVVPENVIDGEFSYSSSGQKARHTVAMVAWNDPDNLYKQTIEVIEDAQGIARYGYNPTKIDLLGCTSRGQAHRHGLWTLLTELYATQIVTYRAGFDHARVRPGDLIAIQDPSIANIEMGGRLEASSTASSLVLDKPVTLNSGTSYSITVLMPDGKPVERAITTRGADLAVLALATALPSVPDPAAVWQIEGDIVSQLFTVVSRKQVEPHIFEITGLQHEPSIFPAVDDGAPFVPLEVSEFPRVVLAPTNLTARQSTYFENGIPRQSVIFSWTAGQPFNSVAYFVTAIRASGSVVTLPRTTSTSVEFLDATPGEWTFIVQAEGVNGALSDTSQLVFTVTGWEGQQIPTITGLQIKGGGTTFAGRAATLEWDVSWPNQLAPYPLTFVVRITDADTLALLHQETVTEETYTYEYELNRNNGGPRRRFRVAVSARDAIGREGVSSAVVVSNPAPAAVIPTAVWTSESIGVSYTAPADPDFSGCLIWLSKTSSFNPLTTAPVFDGLVTFTLLKADPDTTYYIRLACYDALGKDPAGLNISGEISVRTNTFPIDTQAPDIPTNLALSTALVTTATGGSAAEITATWSLVSNSNFGFYEAEILEGDPLNALTFWTNRQFLNSTRHTWRNLKPGVNYAVRVRSVNATRGAYSGWSPVVQIVAAKNLTKPGAVTSLTAVAAVESASISWTNPTDADLAYVEIWYGATAATTPTTLLAKVPVPLTFYVDSGLRAAGGSRKYWARPVNSSGTLGDYTAAVTATSASITAAMIANNIIDATKIATSLEVPRVVATLPATKTGQFVTLSSDGFLYRWDATASAYTKFTPAANISGQITDAQIAALAATKVSGQLTDAQLAAISSAKLVGKVVASQIESITNLQISTQLTSSQIASLDAAKVAGTLSDTQLAGISAGKLIGKVVAAQVDTIGATQITGTLTNAQIADLAATKITGQLSDTQIAALAATKISGQLTNAQLAAIDAAKVTGQLANTQIAGMDASKLIGTINTNQITAGAITAALFASNIQPASIVTTLPSATGYTGPRLVMNTTDGKVYRYTGTAFVASVPSTDITGTLTDAQIAGLAATKVTGQLTDAQIAGLQAAKLAGQITGTQITDGAISTAKLAAGSVTAGAIAAGAITASKLTVTDISNMVLNGEFTENDAASTAGWTYVPGNGVSYIEGPQGNGDPPGRFRLRSNFRDQAWSNYIGVNSEDDLYLSAWCYNTDTSTANLMIATAYADNAIGGYYTVASTTLKNQWVRLEGRIKVPAGTQKVRVLLQTERPGEGGNLTYWGRVQCRRAASAQLIVDGAITADKIAANTITGNKIAGQTITAGNLAAGTITANEIAGSTITGAKIAANTIQGSNLVAGTIQAREIAAGSIAASKLAIASSNMAYNPRYDQGTRGFVHAQGWPNHTGMYVNNEWAPSGFKSLASNTPATVAQIGSTYTDFNAYLIDAAGTTRMYPATAGVTYEVSACVSAHRCAARLFIAWTRADGSVISYVTGNQIVNNQHNNNYAYRDFGKSKAIGVAPAATTGFYIILRAEAPYAGDGPYVFWSALMVAATVTGATEVSDYVDPGTTIIEGSSILTNSLHGNRITGNTITGDKIAARQIAAGHVQAGQIWAEHIAAGNVTSDKIAANAVTAGKIDAGAITAREIAAGAIVASKLTLSDISNMILNGDFATGNFDGWGSVNPGSVGGVEFIGGGDPGGAYRLRSNARDMAWTNYVAGQEGDVIYFSATVHNQHAGRANAILQTVNGSGAGITFDVVAWTDVKSAWVRIEGRYTLPAGTSRFRVLLQCERTSQDSTLSTYWGRVSARRAASAQMIVDGAITTDRLAANSVVASKLAIASANMAYNPRGDQNLRGFSMGGTWPMGTSSMYLENPGTWAPTGFRAVALRNSATAATIGSTYGDVVHQRVLTDGSLANYPATAGVTYEFSVCMSAHRCKGTFYVAWLNSSGAVITYTQSNEVTTSQSGETPYKNFSKATVVAAAPVGTTQFFIILRAYQINANDAYCFFAAMMYAPAFTGATQTSPYVDPGVTTIDGGNIVTNSLHGSRITAGTISADRIVANSITSGQLAADSVTASQIAAGAVSTSELAANAVTAEKISAGVITAREIAGSTITGDKIAARQISAGHVVAGQIWAEHIAGNQISGSHIIARTIGAGHIAVDTITATEIAAGAITASEIATNAITATHISAGVITSREIVAGSILASRLVLTDSSNMLSNGDFQNPSTNAASLDNWYVSPGGTTEVDTANGGDSGGYHRCKSNKRDCAYSEWIMVRPGDAINLSARVYNTNTQRANLMMIWADGAGGNAGYPGAAYTDVKNAWTDLSGQVTIPEGIHKFQVLLQIDKPSDGGNWAYWGKVQARKAANAMMIVDGAIIASKISAGAVEADKIAANAITAAKISAGAVGTSQLAAGAITADKIGVGLNSGNMLHNSDFTNGIDGFQAGWFSDGIAPQDFGQDGYWCIPGTFSARIHRTDTPGNNVVADYTLKRRLTTGWDHKYPCQPYQRYEFSAYASTHRCKSQLIISWLDGNGNSIRDDYSNVIDDWQGRTSLDGWPRMTLVVNAPPGATYIYAIFRAIWKGQADPYCFFLCPYLAVAQAGQQTCSPWQPQSLTVIDGGFIATDSLHANRLTAYSITADRIASGQIWAQHIAGRNITAGHIQAGQVWAEHIAAGNVTADKIAVNAIEAKHLRASQRGIGIIDLAIQVRKSDRYVSWGGGYITYVDSNGYTQAQWVEGGGRQCHGHTTIGWFPGEGYLRVYDETNGNWSAQYGNPDFVPLAYYSGYGSSAGLIAFYGNTIIDGDRIVTRSIQAAQIAVGAINADHIGAGQITADKIAAGNVTADKIGAGTLNTGLISIGNANFQLDSNASNRRLILKDDNGQTRVVLGKISDVAYGDRMQPYGLAMWDQWGTLIMNGGGFHGGALWARTISADRIGANAITASELSGGRLIVAEAQIGEATIGNLRLVNNAVSTVVSASSSGNNAGVSIYVRGTGKVLVKAGRHGNPGQQVGANFNTGNLRVSRNNIEIFAIPANYMFRWDQGAGGSYKYPLGHNLQITEEIGAGSYFYTIADDNNIGLGGVYIEVTELSK